MRHRWIAVSVNVALCRQCGLKRVRAIQRGTIKTSRPFFTYYINEDRFEFADKCNAHWPENLFPEWRASLYKLGPAQGTLFDANDVISFRERKNHGRI